jgi:hypothetical protein
MQSQKMLLLQFKSKSGIAMSVVVVFIIPFLMLLNQLEVFVSSFYFLCLPRLIYSLIVSILSWWLVHSISDAYRI